LGQSTAPRSPGRTCPSSSDEMVSASGWNLLVFRCAKRDCVSLRPAWSIDNGPRSQLVFQLLPARFHQYLSEFMVHEMTFVRQSFMCRHVKALRAGLGRWRSCVKRYPSWGPRSLAENVRAEPGVYALPHKYAALQGKALSRHKSPAVSPFPCSWLPVRSADEPGT
jgi:hypothetical protein